MDDWWAKKALIMLKIWLKIVQNKSASSFFVDGVSGCEPLGQKRVLVEKRLMLCLSTGVKAPGFASLCTKWVLPMR